MTNWKEIHPEFTNKTNRWNQETRQQRWEKQGFDYQQTAKWINLGLQPQDWEFATYLRWKDYQPDSDLNLEQLREEFIVAQNYLDCFYPKEKRKKIKELDIISFGDNRKNLKGKLDLSDFINLEKLNCSRNQLTALKLKELICWDNQLTSLDLTNCNQLEKVWCRANYLQNLKFPSQPENLISLDLNDNNFPKQDLSMFSNLVNLRELYLGNYSVYLREDERIKEKISQGFYNRFSGSLQPLQNLSKLEKLDIRNTDIDNGLEYLSDNVKNFCCSFKERPAAKCQVLTNLLADKQGTAEADEWDRRVKDFSQKLQTYKQKMQAQILQTNLPNK